MSVPPYRLHAWHTVTGKEGSGEDLSLVHNVLIPTKLAITGGVLEAHRYGSQGGFKNSLRKSLLLNGV